MNPNGRYTSRVPAGASGRELDLRVDVSSGGPLSVVSGDLFDTDPARTPRRQFVGTWMVDTPVTRVDAGQVVISGATSLPGSLHTANARIVVNATRAVVTFTSAGGQAERFACDRVSDMLRSLEVFVDTVRRAGNFIEPIYDTAFLPGPPGLTTRAIDVGAALREAGVAVTQRPVAGSIDDGGIRFEKWSDAELNEILGDRFLQERPDTTWPQWALWALFASKHEEPGIQGVMFDDVGQQQRQGLAIFRNQETFDGLPPVPLNGASPEPFMAMAMRQYLFTWIHELGHALNLTHPVRLGSGDTLSWMDNPSFFMSAETFWKAFTFAFRHNELTHLRHGALDRVIPGGAPFIGGDDDLDTEFPEVADTPAGGQLEILLRGRVSYGWLAPVKIEVRLRNRSDEPLEIDTRLYPEYGRLIVFICRPDGSVHRYVPLARKLASPESWKLQATGSTKGLERYSASIDITYGSRGFSFRRPGRYVVRAYYRHVDGGIVRSNDLTIDVAAPAGDEERLEHDYFRAEVGTCLYFNGSRAPRLRGAMDTLRRLAAHHGDDMARADLALTITNTLGRRFYGLTNGDLKLRCVAPARPGDAIGLTNNALEIYRRRVDKRSSLQYSRLVYRRAGFWKNRRQPQPEHAARELRQLRDDLALIANGSVLDQIGRDADAYRKR
jgi:hypothetical protein